ncbi:MAG: hypothetical protein HYX73_08305 [Acidobacteria bacterium]|nr:hypothetical protein [Acidobacteriota bacterium]
MTGAKSPAINFSSTIFSVGIKRSKGVILSATKDLLVATIYKQKQMLCSAQNDRPLAVYTFTRNCAGLPQGGESSNKGGMQSPFSTSS